MKKCGLILALVLLAFAVVGCEDDTKEKAKRLTFENQSSYVLVIQPLTIEWNGFSLPPGEKKTLHDIDNIDHYVKSPSSSKVKRAIASKPRYVIYVNAEPSASK